MSQDLLISVVIPTCHRSASLVRLLEALARQSMPVEAFEVIVVDDTGGATSSGHPALVTGQALGLPLTLICLDHNRGPAAARNAGWRCARAELVAFTDDDTVPDRDWLRNGSRALASCAPWGAATGRVRVPSAHPGGPPTDHELMTRGLESARFVTANVFVRREVLQRLTGFDERFLRPWREDSEFEFRLQDAGIAIGHVADAVVDHPVRPERWGVSLRQQKNVFYDVLLFREHPRRYLTQLGYRVPLLYYGIVASAFAVLLLSALAIWPAAFAASSVCLAQIIILALRRLRPTSRAPGHVWEMLATSALIPFLSLYWRLRGALHFKKLLP